MDLDCAQVMINVTNVAVARDFYINKLGFKVIESHEQSFAFRAGAMRFSVSKNGQKLDIESDPANTKIIFRTQDIEKSVEALRARGVAIDGAIVEAPGFMKFIEFVDPDNNPLFLGQYSRDPLQPV